jgi:hypothetical protein
MSMVKSKVRLADQVEVLPPARLVEAMLDLVNGETERMDPRFLGPVKTYPAVTVCERAGVASEGAETKGANA